MPRPDGFEYVVHGDGEVVILHHGRRATTLRGARAQEFLDEVGSSDSADAQELMARLTGNYKRGNEREAASHPRHRGRSRR